MAVDFRPQFIPMNDNGTVKIIDYAALQLTLAANNSIISDAITLDRITQNVFFFKGVDSSTKVELEISPDGVNWFIITGGAATTLSGNMTAISADTLKLGTALAAGGFVRLNLLNGGANALTPEVWLSQLQ